MRGVVKSASRSRGIGTGIHDDEEQLQPQNTAYIPVSAGDDDEHEKDGKHHYDEKDGSESLSLSDPPVYQQEEHFHTMPYPHFNDMKG
ncbi:hypothetical protein FIBSPDRAFT_874548 [Athelia psychrophila]|uniref:Uncharacterized protein n=1 Tax=Athelia psychrophila TaxID=1759441 RepID=A0A165XD47_9AGAM|nr:hypothetical protein FIBSPDRAFT_874548 [Fibularhizoctonia sp. CBS 109695]